MRDWLSSRIGRKPSGTLAARLRGYPPDVTPHPGPGLTLTDAQAQENLAHFEAVRPQRLALVAGLLRSEAAIDLPAALADARHLAAPLAAAVHAWAGRAWPPLCPRPAPGLLQALVGRREGGRIVYAMLGDLATALGELISRGNPDWRWGLDLDPQNIADEMPSARRIVLLAGPAGAHHHPFVLDVEAVVFHRFLHAGEAPQRLLDPLQRMVQEALRGDAMAYWRTAAAPPDAGRADGA